VKEVANTINTTGTLRSRLDWMLISKTKLYILQLLCEVFDLLYTLHWFRRWSLIPLPECNEGEKGLHPDILGARTELAKKRLVLQDYCIIIIMALYGELAAPGFIAVLERA